MMDKRFWLAFAGFLLFVGGGGVYLLRAQLKRRRFLRFLMGLPKAERKLWYRLRMRGYEIVDYRPLSVAVVNTPFEPLRVTLQVEWLVRWQNNLWAVIRKPVGWTEKHCLQSFFAAMLLYDIEGVLWYEEESGGIYSWSMERRSN